MTIGEQMQGAESGIGKETTRKLEPEFYTQQKVDSTNNQSGLRSKSFP